MQVTACNKEKFYDSSARNRGEIDSLFASNELVCIEESQIQDKLIKHNEDRDFRKLLSVYFNPCDFVNRATCKGEQEIAIWTEDKQILVLYNQQEFNFREAEQ